MEYNTFILLNIKYNIYDKYINYINNINYNGFSLT